MGYTLEILLFTFLTHLISIQADYLLNLLEYTEYAHALLDGIADHPWHHLTILDHNCPSFSNLDHYCPPLPLIDHP